MVTLHFLSSRTFWNWNLVRQPTGAHLIYLLKTLLPRLLKFGFECYTSISTKLVEMVLSARIWCIIF